MTMAFLEVFALCLVGAFLLVHVRGHPRPGSYSARFVMVAAAAWVAEESVIRIYQFYGYSPDWDLFLGKTPMLVLLVWTYLIHSAWDISSQIISSKRKLVPLLASGIILTDALAIETVAVSAGAWSWTRPGIFGLPPVGLAGWTYFAFFCLVILENRREKPFSAWDLLLLVVPAAGTHLLLIITWWGVFRWLSIIDYQVQTIITAWLLSLGLTCVVVRRRLGEKVEKRALWLRLPAAVIFYIYLANLIVNNNGPLLLGVLLAAWAPPYLVMMAQQYHAFRPGHRGKLDPDKDITRREET